MAKGSDNSAGRRSSSRNTKPYDANNVSILRARDTRLPPILSPIPRRIARPSFARVVESGKRRVASRRASGRSRLPRTRIRRGIPRMPALLPTTRSPRAYPRCHGYVSPPDNLNLCVHSAARAEPPREIRLVHARHDPAGLSWECISRRRVFSDPLRTRE